MEEPVDRFVNESYFQQMSMVDSIMALNESSAELMDFWERDPVDFMIQVADLPNDVREFFREKREKMNQLYDRIKGKQDLSDLAIEGYTPRTEYEVDTVFKGSWEKTVKLARQAMKDMLEALRILLAIDIRKAS
jgi:hypothetical protein